MSNSERTSKTTFNSKPSTNLTNRSRSRSGERKKSKYNQFYNTNQPENQKFKISSGPLHFQGSKGAVLKKTPIISRKNTSEHTNSSRNEVFMKPKPRKMPSNEMEYSAFEWEEFEKDIERSWYDLDEGGIIDENEEHYFIGNTEKFKAIEDHFEKQKQIQANINFKQLEKNAENNKWELNRMVTSGVFKIKFIFSA